MQRIPSMRGTIQATYAVGSWSARTPAVKRGRACVAIVSGGPRRNPQAPKPTHGCSPRPRFLPSPCARGLLQKLLLYALRCPLWRSTRWRGACTLGRDVAPSLQCRVPCELSMWVRDGDSTINCQSSRKVQYGEHPEIQQISAKPRPVPYNTPYCGGRTGGRLPDMVGADLLYLSSSTHHKDPRESMAHFLIPGDMVRAAALDIPHHSSQPAA